MTTTLAQSPSATCSPSLTPETDALELEISDINEPWKLCRKLERERNEEMGFRSEWCDRYRKAHTEMMAMKERLMKLADSLAEDAKNHRKLADGASSETTKICHLSAWDAYKNSERRVMDAVHNEAAF